MPIQMTNKEAQHVRAVLRYHLGKTQEELAEVVKSNRENGLALDTVWLRKEVNNLLKALSFI